MEPAQAIHLINGAIEELESIRVQIMHDDNLDSLDGELHVNLEMVFMRLNRLWNARHASKQQYHDATETEFEQWSKFPSDLLL